MQRRDSKRRACFVYSLHYKIQPENTCSDSLTASNDASFPHPREGESPSLTRKWDSGDRENVPAQQTRSLALLLPVFSSRLSIDNSSLVGTGK